MMRFLEMLIHRPVVSMVLSLMLICLGVFAFMNLSVQQYPNIVQPVITVTTTYVGADPELIEKTITDPIEDQIVGVEGLKYYSSTSEMGSSTITMTFHLDADLDEAESAIRSRVNAASDNFPTDAEPPVIERAPGSQPIMYIQLDSDDWSVAQLTEYYQLYVRPLYEMIPGIQELDAYGVTYGMRLWIDPEKLAARGLTPADVVDVVQQQNLDLPGGQLVNRYMQYDITTRAELNTVEEYNRMVIAYRDGAPIRLRDVGYAELAGEYEPPEFAFWSNGQTTFAFGVSIFPHANALDVGRACRELVDVVRRDLPEGVEFKINYDRTLFIEYSIAEVVKTLGEAIILVVLVISLFLRSPRATLIPVITIPLCLFGAMALIYVIGFTINVMTMLALVLAIGLVVDDAIVVVENTFRHIEGGMPRLEAAVTGAKEISFPIIATTSVLAIVYVPIGFQSGQSGRLFQAFAFTLAGTVLISGYIALTLSPMMCSRLLPKQKKTRAEETKLTRVYGALLSLVLKRLRPLVLLAAAAVGVGAYLIYRDMPTELLPTEDQDLVFVLFKAPDGTNFDYIRSYALDGVKKLEQHVPEMTENIAVVGYPSTGLGMAAAILKPKKDRERSAQQIVADLDKVFADVSGVLAIPMVPPPPVFAASSNQHVNFVMTTVGEYETLEAALNGLLDDPRTAGYIIGSEPDLDLHVMNYNLVIDRDRAESVNLTAQDVAMTAAASLAPYRVTKIKRSGKNYDVFVQMPLESRQDPSVLEKLYARNAQTQDLVPLSSVASLEPYAGPIELNHYNSQRSVTVNANVAPGSSLGAALDYLKTYAEGLDDVNPQFTGYSDTFVESQGQFALIFAAAIIVVYLVLSAMFNSFIDPFIVLLTVPLAMFGGLALLRLTGGSLNLYSNIGLVTLVGLISKHGILIVDFANQSRREGMDVTAAAIHAAKLRIRPILMTTGAMVLGSVPLALAGGAGSENRHPLGLVIIGGLLFGTCLTLLVIPVVYSYLARLESGKKPVV